MVDSGRDLHELAVLDLDKGTIMKPLFTISPPDLAVEEVLAGDSPSRDACAMRLFTKNWDLCNPGIIFDATTAHSYVLSFEEYATHIFQLVDRFRAEIAKTKQTERL